MSAPSMELTADAAHAPSKRDESNRRQALFRQPKTVADRDLERQIALFLSQRGFSHNREFEVQADSGTVIIQGSLPSAQAKRFCLQCCRHVAGVIKIVDQLEVEGADNCRAAVPASSSNAC